MPRRCTVCIDSRRAEIEEALKAGATLREVAVQPGLSASAIHRHSRNHLPPQDQIEGTGPTSFDVERRVDELEVQVGRLTRNVRLIAEFLAMSSR